MNSNKVEQNNKFITHIRVYDVEKRYKPSKHYCKLLDKFVDEGGEQNPEKRIIPFLPGKIIFGRSNIKSVALNRMFSINIYCKKLITLKKEISACEEVLKFFEINNDDIAQSIEGHDLDKKNDDLENTEELDISSPIKKDEYLVIHNFNGITKSELTIKKGAKVLVSEKNLNGWWFVELNDGSMGYVPASCLQKIANRETNEMKLVKTILAEPHIVLNDYEAKNSDEISVKKANYVLVLEKSYTGFWKIRCGNNEGLVPAVYLKSMVKKISNNVRESLNLYDLNQSSTYSIYKEPEHEQQNSSFQYNQDSNSNNYLNSKDFSSNANESQNISLDKSFEESESLDVKSDKQGEMFSVVESYNDTVGDGVNLVKGQRATVLIKNDVSKWWYVKLDDSTEGWAPAPYLAPLPIEIPKEIKKSPPPRPPRPRPAALLNARLSFTNRNAIKHNSTIDDLNIKNEGYINQSFIDEKVKEPIKTEVLTLKSNNESILNENEQDFKPIKVSELRKRFE